MKVNVNYTVHVPDDKVEPLVALAKSAIKFLKPPDGRTAIKELLRQQGTSLLKCRTEELNESVVMDVTPEIPDQPGLRGGSLAGEEPF